MSLNFLTQNPELQSLVVMLFLGAGIVSLREPKNAGRWCFVFFLLLMAVMMPGTTGFVFLLAAETFSYLAFDELNESDPRARTVRFIINISIATICLLTAVVLNQTKIPGASVLVYVWIYFSFVGLPFGLARTRGPECRGSILVYLFCFALCFRQFVGVAQSEEWTTVLLVMSLLSVLIGNSRVTGALAVIGLCGLSPLHFAFAIPFLAVSVTPGILAASFVPIATLGWLCGTLPVTELSFITFPALVFFAARSSYLEKPQAIAWRCILPTSFALGLFGVIWFLNRDLMEYIYDKTQGGDAIVWLAFLAGLLFWNVMDRKVKWFVVGVREWHLPASLSLRYENMKKLEPIGVVQTPRWENILSPAQTQKFLRGPIQLTAWFGLMFVVMMLFYWLAV